VVGCVVQCPRNREMLMTPHRRRVKQTQSLEERMAQHARLLRDKAELLPQGSVRDAALRRAREAETGAQMNDWLKSTEPKAPA